IVKKALAKDRDRRYEAAGDLLIDLKNLKQEIELQARLNVAGLADSKDVESPTTSAPGLSVATGEQLAPRTDGAAAARTASSPQFLTSQIKKHRRTVALSLVTLLIAVAAVVYLTSFTSGSGEAIDSVAVLPFVNAGNDPNAEYLSDGISDGII